MFARRTPFTEMPKLWARPSPDSIAFMAQRFAKKNTALAAVTSTITASWLLLTRPRSPNVQKTTAATWESSAKYCTIVVPAVNSADKATPSNTMLSGVISRTRDKRRITTVESIAPANAKNAVVTGSAVEMPS